MLLRRGQRLLSSLAAFMAVMALLVFSFVPPGDHAPALHLQGVETVVGKHSIDHGDHSHDEFDVPETSEGGAGHHHADHSHEKIDLAASAGVAVRLPSEPRNPDRASHQAEGPFHSIERPPRSVFA